MTPENLVHILRQKASGEPNSLGEKWGDWICLEAAEMIEHLRSELEPNASPTAHAAVVMRSMTSGLAAPELEANRRRER